MKLATVGLAAAALIGATVVPLTIAAPASAASCSGSQVDSIPVKRSGKTYGTLKLYWNGSTGTNCARLDRVVDYGTKSGMILQLWACAKGTPSTAACHRSSIHDEDSGQFGQYAGPVSVKGKGKCIVVQAGVADKNHNWANYNSQKPFHCG
ncbi:hypothetical protein ABZ297_17425 [Nonomuraea sp. NPDC005983]|uniref:hypothetical protein n=1 Tax=Nonomuraea sp. NPDC005983 TaxID=3155595 RepID=UPI0033A1FD5C